MWTLKLIRKLSPNFQLNFLSFRISSVSYFLDDFRKRLVERDWLDTGVRGVRTAVCHCVCCCALCVHWCAVLCVLCCVCHSTAYSCGGPWISWNTTPPTHDQLCPSDHHHHALHEGDEYDQGAGASENCLYSSALQVSYWWRSHILKDWSPSPSIHISFSLKHFLFAAKRWMLALSVTHRQP